MNHRQRVLCEVTAAIEPFIGTHFGNPSSGHVYGRVCGSAVATARARVGALVGAADAEREIIFTGCGSEADNLAIRGVVVAEHARRRAAPRGGGGTAALPHVVTTIIEHPAVTACVRALEQEASAMCCFSHACPAGDVIFTVGSR